MAKNIKVLVNTGNEETNKSFDVTAGSGKAGKPTTIKAVKGARYHLEDPAAKKVGPENIRSKRVGKNLHVMLDGSSEADLIIEGYYDDAMLTENNRGLYGRAEDGKLYEYIPEDPTPAGMPINLADGGKPVSQVLGGGQIGEEFALSGLVVAAAGFNALTAAAAATGAAALAGGGGGGGGTSGGAVIPTAPAAAPASYADNVGSKQSTTSTDAKTDDTTPGINIGQVPTGATPKLYVDGVYVPATYDSVTGTLTPNAPLSEGPHSITYSLSNTAGESAKSPAMPLTIDTIAPTTTAAVTEITDNVGAVQGAVANGGVTDDTNLTLKGTLSAPLAAGENIRIYDGSTFLGTATVGANNTWTFTDTRTLTNGAAVSYTASVADEALNQSAAGTAFTATVDTSVPTISITSVAGDTVTDLVNGTNGTFDATERGANATTVTTKPVISGISTLAAGLTAKITLNIAGVDETATATIGSNGTWSVELTDAQAVKLNHGNTYTINASVTNSAGTTAIDSNNGVVINTARPDVPTVINNNAGTTTPTLTGLAMKEDPSAAGTFIALQIGDTISVTVGGATYNVTIGSLPNGFTYDATTHKWSVDTATLAPTSGTLSLVSGNAYNVGVSVTSGISVANPSGITKTDIGSNELVVNTTAPTITLNTISGGYINAAEKASDLVITGTTNAQVGSKVTITGLDGTSRTADVYAVINAPNTFTLTISGTDVARFTGTDTTKTVQASVVNAYKLTGTDTENVIIDTALPSNTVVTLDAISGDDLITAGELAGTVRVTGKVTGEFTAGDAVTVTVNGVRYAGTVDASGKFIIDGINGSDLNADSAKKVLVNIEAHDAAGNPAPFSASRNYTLDTQTNADKTSLVVDPIDGDNIIELNSSGTLAVTGKVTGVFATGDTVTLYVNNKLLTGTVATNGTFSINVDVVDLKADTDTKLEARIAVTTPSGTQTATTSQDYAVEDSSNVGRVTALTLDPVTADNIINAADNTGNIAITGKVTGAFVAGDTVTLKVNGNPVTGAVLTDGTFSIPVAASALVADTDTQIEASITGTGGTAATAVQNYAVNTALPNGGVAPTVEITTDTDNNSYVNNDELNGASSFTVKASFDRTKVSVGDKVIFTDGTTPNTVTLTSADLTAGFVTTTYAKPNENATLSVTAKIQNSIGNDTPNSATDTATLDTTAPTTTVTIDSISDDTGVSSTDFITNDNNGLTIHATLGAALATGEKLWYSKDNGTTWTNITTSVTGTTVSHVDSTLTTTSTIQLRVGDAANNYAAAATKRVVIDTSGTTDENGNPDANTSATVSIDAITDDSGASSTDFITSDNGLVYSGAVANFTANGDVVKLELKDASNAVLETIYVTPASNAWSWTDTNTSRTDGNYTLVATVVDKSGNRVNTAAAGQDTQIVTIDTSGGTNTDHNNGSGTPTPDANTTAAVTIDAISTDTGVSSSDFITSDNSLIYSGSVTGFANNGDVVKVQITPAGGATVTAYATVTMTGVSTGTWSLDKSAINLADGNYTIVATLADKAGNQVGTSQATQIVTIDTSGSNNTDHGNGSGTPTTDGNATSATASIDSISTDSGFSATDFITNDATLLVKGVASISSAGVAAGDQLLVEIKDNNNVVVATQYVKPDASGNWQLNNQANTLADGKYTIAVHVVDLAGNKVKADADTQVLIVDTNKGGTDASSNTNSGTGASEVDGNVANGAVSITGITQDTGFNTADFITADGTLAISGTSNLDTTAGDKVRVQIVDSTCKVVAQTYVGTTGAWSFDNTANTLSDGSYTLKAAIVDAADNIVKAGTPQALVISSTAAPTSATIGISAISDDTGTSTVDFITQDRTLTIHGTVNNFDSTAHKLLVQVINSANQVVTSEANVTVSGGTWTLNNGTLTNGSLTDGKYTIRAVLTSSAGVEIASTVTTHSLAIDNAGGTNPDNGSGGSNPTDANTTAALSITTIHDVAHGSVDSGASTSDFITNDATLIVQGSVTGFSNTGAGAGDKVRVQIVDSANTVVAQQYVTPDANGAWSFDNTNNTLKDGKYNVKAIIVDAAGNPVNTEVTHTLVIDTNHGGTDNSSNPGNNNGTNGSGTDANATSATISVASITTDSGYSATDYITADGTLTISGTTTGFTNAVGTGSAGDKVRVQILNAQGDVVAETYTDPVSGAWSFNNQANTLFDGNYTIKAAIVDAAGNVVKAGADQALVIDNGNTPTNATLAISSISDDSGVSTTDFVTTDTTLTITGTTAGFNTSGTDKILVQVLNGTTVVTSGYATTGVNTWSYSAAALTDGNYTIRAVYTTATGTEISPPQTHSLVVDTAAGTNPENGSGSGSGSNATDPNAASTVTVSIAGITDDTGVSATDLITTDQTLVISGNTANFSSANGGAGDVVRVQIINTVGTAGNRTAYVNVDANGNWSLDNVANTLSAGTYTLKADIVDKAGNTVKLGTDRTLTVQTALDNTTNSAAVVAVTAITDDTGASSTDYITSDNVLTFSGTVTGYTANGANSDKVKVELLAANGTTVIATAYVDVTVTTGTNATWAWPYQTLQADGNYSVRATLVNTAGITVNTGATGTNTHAFTIDSHGGTNVDPNGNGSSTTDANTSATVAITNISDDTGPSANDFVTKDTTLTYSGTVAGFTANGDKVKLELLAADGTTVVATAYVDTSVTGTGAQNGTWTWAYQTAQATGNYTVRATIVDVPGNRVNAAAGGQATQIIVVDASGTSNPDNGQGSGSGGNNGGGTDTNASATATITTIHDVANGSVDSGADSTDFVTNDNTLVVKGTVAGFSSTGATKGDQLLVTILSGSTIVATQYVTPDSAGNWVMNNKANALADGAYTINVDIVDLAGNAVKAAAATHSLVIDTNQGGTDPSTNPGNGSGTSGTDANAGSTVAVAVSAITDDTGFSTTDYITADHSLVISGTTANFSNTAGSTGDTVRVQVLDSTGKVVAEKYVTPTGNNWSADITGTNLADGSYTIRNAIVDKAGNIVKAGTDQPLVISSTAAPTSATVSIASISTDSGYDVTDFITQDNTLTINGVTNGYNSGTDKVKVQVLENNSIVMAEGYATVDGAGKWTFDATAAHTGGAASLADGSYTVRAVLTNTAGVEVTGTAATHALVVDNASGTNYGGSNGTNGSGATDANTGATVTVTTIHDVANGSVDSGSNSADFITNDNTLVIQGTTVGFSATGAGALDKVRVQILDSNNVVVTTQYVTPDSAGNWSIDHKATALMDGKYTIQADIVDAADNLVKAGTAKALVIDTNQGGTDNSSNPGNNNGTNGSGTDANGTSGSTSSISITGITDDTGFSATDFITADGTLVISGTSSFVTTGGAAGDQVRVQIVNAQGNVVGETYVSSSGAWSFDNHLNTLVDGTYTLKAAIVDAAGNVVKAAADQALVINSGHTPTTATLAISSISTDSGTSATDFVTNDNTLTITGTTDGFTVNGTDKIWVQVIKTSDGSVASSGYATHLTNSANAGWIFVTDGGSANVVNAATLANGTYTIRAVYTTNAGVEISTPVTHSLVIDNAGGTNFGGNNSGGSNNGNGSGTTDPNAAVALSTDSITEDTGVSATDWLTADNQLVINGSAPGFTALNGGEGDVVRVQIFNGATLVRESFVTVDATGHWALDNTANTLADGSYTIKAAILDAAGNSVKTAADQALTIRTGSSNGSNPNNAASVAINAISDDTGNTTDYVTSDDTLTYSGTVGNFTPGHNDVVKLVLTNARGDVVATQYVTPTTSGTGAQSGTWSWAYQTTQSEGDYTLTATLVDQAGTRLVSSGSNSTQATQAVVIDRSAPDTLATITSIDDNEGNVQGVVATGGTTDDTTPGVSGTLNAALATGETVRVYDGSTYLGNATIAVGSTAWTFADTRTLNNGATVSYTARVADTALNEGTVSTAYTATINTSVPGVTITSIAGDTVADAGNGTYSASERGASPTTTEVASRPVISGTSVNVEQGRTVSVVINIGGVDKTYTATVGSGGTWTTPALSDADAVALNHGSTYTITASVSNTAGKVAVDSNNGMLIDIAAPDIPTVLNNNAGTLTPTLTGAAQKAVPGTPVTYIALATGDTLTVTVGGATYSGTVGSLPTGMTYDAATHTWSLNTATATATSGALTLASGNTYDVGVTVVAGSVTEHDISSGELVINTTAPTITLDPISGGYINAVEKGQALTLTGTTTAQVGSQVTVTGLDGNPYTGTVLAGATGQPNVFSITVPAASVTAFSVDGSTLTATATVTNAYHLSGTDTESVVIDATGPSFSSAAAATAVTENTAASTVLYTAAATDAHGVTYSLKGTGDDSLFNIDSTTGAVKLNTAANYEGKASYAFTVVATDAAGNTTDKAVTLAVTNVDEVAPNFTSNTTATAVYENIAANTAVYTAAATDADFNSPATANSVTYSLKAATGNVGKFSINSSTGVVTLTESPNYEVKNSYSFTVIATDAAGNAKEHAVTLGVNNLNEAPTATSSTITIVEDGSKTFAANDFGFADASDGTAPNALSAVIITTLPTAGTLKLNGTDVTLNQSIAVADLGNLVFAPAANGNGTGYASIGFKVQDNGGTANSGADTSTTANTLTFDVTAVNDAPTGTNATITVLEDGSKTFAASDFGFADTADTPANALSAVIITTLPTAGTLKLNGVDVTLNQSISAADIAASKLVYAPAANGNGTGYASIGFKVQDNGGTTNSGVDTSASANTLTFDVTAVNDAPTATNATITVLEDGSKVFAAADFGLNDIDGNALSAVIITTLPTAGTLKLNGTDVTLNQSISAADIAANKLVFAPAANANGTGYASIGFKVQDNGGTANSGVDTSTTANTLTFNVTAVNDAATFSGDISKPTSETDVAQTITGQLNVADIDSATTVVAQTNVAGSAGLGHFTITTAGAWTYVMDNAQNQLKPTDVITDSLTVSTADGTTQTISVVITGTNDAPIVANALADTTATATVAITNYVVPANAFSDVDSTSLTYTATLADGSALSTVGLSFDAATRTVSGTPTTAGTISVKVTATDGSLSANDTFDIVVASPDSIAPTLRSTSPVDNGSVAQTNLAGNLTLNFSEAVKAGTGLIELYNASGTLVESFNAATDVGSAGGVVTGWNTSTLTLNPFANLTAGTGYYVKVAATAVTDLAGNAYAGITDATTFNFVTLNTDGSTPVVPPYGGQTNSQLGFSVSSAGDVNGDGYDDVIVDANKANTDAGAAYVVYGNAAGAGVSLVNGTIAPSLGFKIAGASGAGLGYSVSAAGDVNGDGFADVIVGAANGNMAYVVYGSASAPSAAALDFSTTTLATSNGFSIKGVTTAGAFFGASVSSAGDVNGDGLADLMVGVAGNSTLPNVTFIIYGKTNAANLDLSANTIAPSDGYKINGIAGSMLGLSTSNAGDVNGDGLADQIIGAYNQSSGAGAAYIIYGNSTGTGVDLNGVMNASTGYMISGGAGNYLGYSVSSAGDVNGDGLADVVVTAQGINAAYVIYGNASRTSLDLSGGTIATSNGYKIIGQAGTSFGYSVSSAGDVNGDGLGDVIVGAIASGTNSGTAYVVYGNTTGATVDISTGVIAASNGFKLATSVASGQFGHSVSNAGDINGDGLSDLIIGARATNSYAGAYYIVLGGTQTVTSAVNLTGTAADEAVMGTAGNDTLTGGGGVDRFFAGKGNDTIVLQASDVTNLSAAAGTTREAIQGGEGFDTLQVSAASVNLDLTAISNAGAMGFEENSRIESIERINLGADATANTLTLTAKDVNDMADFNSIHTGTASDDGKTWTNVGAGTALSATTKFHQVVVDGTSADTLTLEVGNGYWANVGEVNNGTTGYYVYQNTDTNSQVIVDKTVVVNNKDSSPAGSAVIDLLGYGKLIKPVQVEGKWYYHWDRSGDGTSANTGSLNGGMDVVSHDVLDSIFKYDINGNVNPVAGTNTNSVYRYATINGVQLALPTLNGDIVGLVQNAMLPGTAATVGGNSLPYDEFMAIWDTQNGTGVGTNINGTPTGWVANYYWTATATGSPGVEYHYPMDLGAGYLTGNTSTTINTAQNYAALQVVAANAAPVLDAAQSPTLTSVSASAAAPTNGNTTAGNLVSDLVGGISDTDAGALKGIAITGVHTGGTLYYSVDGGTTWLTPATTLSDTNALLLAADSNTRVYYKANNASGTFTDAITFRAWDMTANITEGVYTDTTPRGGKAQFSTATDTVSVVSTITPGQTPVDLGTSGKLILPVQVGGDWFYYWDRSGDGASTNTGTANGGVDYVSHDVLDSIFKYDINGNVNPGSDTTDVYRYGTINGVQLALPMAGPTNTISANQLGTAVTNNTTTVNPTFGNSYLGVWDASNGTGTGSPIGGIPTGWNSGNYWTATVSGVGHAYVGFAGGTFSNNMSETNTLYTMLQVVKANTAPVLDVTASPTLTSVSASAAAPTNGNLTAGDLVSTLVGGITDADSGALKGIAITGVNAGGTLYYSLNGGTNWKTATGLSDANALLLAADSNTRVYYKPSASGVASDAITFRAWDATSNTAEGVYANTVANGGKSEFSTATDTVGIAVTAPVVLDLNRDGTFSYTQVAMDVNGSNHLSLTQWAGAQDGVLVWDKLGDGLVHDNSQYAFGQYATSTRFDAAGYNRLASDLDGLSDAFDTNHDGVFNAADAKFAEFKVWQDANQNGVSDAGEVRSLADWGITSINLVSDGVQRTPVAGVTEVGQSTAALADGSSMQVADALFAYNALDYSVTGNAMNLLGADMHLDLSSVVAVHSNVNAIDLTGTGANTVKLSLADVLSVATDASIANGVHKLTLTGDANDTVELDLSQWANTGNTVTEGDHTYAVYNASSAAAAQLLIDQHMVLANHG